MVKKRSKKRSKSLSGCVHLGYFKQGDDLAGCLKSCRGRVVPALRRHVDLLWGCVAHLERLAKVIEKYQMGHRGEGKFELSGDSHFIGICGPEVLMRELVKLGLVELDEDVDERDIPY